MDTDEPCKFIFSDIERVADYNYMFYSEKKSKQNKIKTKYEARLLKKDSRIQEKIIRALDTATFCKTYLGARKYVNRAKRLRKKAEAIKYRIWAMNREIVALYSNVPVYSGTVKVGKYVVIPSKEAPPKTGKTALQADAELKKEFDNERESQSGT